MPCTKRSTDVQVIRRVLAGEREDFGLLVERYLSMVYAMAYARLGNHADAEDTAQETFLKALKSLNTLRSKRKFPSWLAAITRAECANVRRAGRPRSQAQRDAPLDTVSIIDVEQRELHETLRRQVLELDNGPREILLLHYFAGMKIRQIAAALKISYPAAAKRIERARRALGERLVDELGPAFEPYTPTKKNAVTIMGVLANAPVPWKTVSQGALAALGSVKVLGSTLTVKHVCVGTAIAAASLVGWQGARQLSSRSLSLGTPFAVTDPRLAGSNGENAASPGESSTATNQNVNDENENRGVEQQRASASVFRGTIAGRVVYEDTGEPVPGMKMFLAYSTRIVPGQPHGDGRTDTITDSFGRFEFTGQSTSPGLQYGLNIRDETGILAADGIAFDLAENQHITGLVFRARKGGIIAGKVYDAYTGDGLAGVEVTANGAAKAVTDTNGSYQLGAHSEKDYRVECSTLPGYAVKTSEKRKRVHAIPGKEIGGIDFRLHLALQVRGTVVDDKQLPVADAEVSIGVWDGPHIPTVHSDADGTFVVDGLPAQSRFYVEAEANGLISRPSGNLTLLDQPLEGLVVKLFPACTVAGTVVDGTGRSMAEATVEWTRRTESSGHSGIVAKTGDDGSFTFSDLPAGNYEFSVSPADGSPVQTVLRYTVEHGDELTDVQLVYASAEMLTISGRITDTEGYPMAGMRLAVMGSEVETSATTNEDGFFIAENLEEGVYQLAYFEQNGHMYHEGRRVEAGSENVDFVLERKEPIQSSGPISGRVVSADSGEPVTSFSYVLKSGVYDDVDPNAQRYTDILETVHASSFREVNHPDGEFVAETYATGDHTIVIRADGYAQHMTALTAPSNDTVIRMEAGARVEGVVLDPQGKPVAGAVIIRGGPRRFYEPGGGYALGSSGSDGTFTAEGLSATPQALSACHRDFGSASVDVTPQVGRVTEVTFRLAQAGGLEGVVFFAEQAIERSKDAEIRVKYDDGTRGYTGLLPIKEDGKYRLNNVRPGTATVTAGLDPYGYGTYPNWRLAKTVEIAAEMVTQVDFAFPSGDAVLTGTVSAEGETVQRGFVWVYYFVDDGELLCRTEIEADGRYDLEDLPEGNALVQVYATSQSGERFEPSFELSIDRSAVIEWNIDLDEIDD